MTDTTISRAASAPCPPIRVAEMVSTGFSLIAVVSFEFAPETVLLVAGIRAYRNRYGEWGCDMPSTGDGGVHRRAVKIPTQWRPQVLAAIAAKAAEKHLLPDADGG